MRRLYLDLPYISSIPEAYKAPSSEILSASGWNLGNFAFRHALHFIVQDFSSFTPIVYADYFKSASHEPVESVLVSCANWLGTSQQDEKSNAYRATAFESIDAPVVCFGLGVQAGVDGKIPELGPNTKRLAQILASKAKLLSVRDQITQDTLRGLGITNSVVTGCPSNFINNDPSLGSQIARRARALLGENFTWNDLRTILSEFSGGHPYSGAVLREHLRQMDTMPAFYVLQTPTLLPLLLNENKEVPPPYQSNKPPEWDPEKVYRVLRANTLLFTSIDGWLDFSRTCDFSLGMRVHGAMVPLQAGVPTLLIGHDSRTIGLGNGMGIPTVTPEMFIKNSPQGPAWMLRKIATIMDNYDARRRDLAIRLRDYLRVNGLTPHAALLDLANHKPHAN